MNALHEQQAHIHKTTHMHNTQELEAIKICQKHQKQKENGGTVKTLT